MTTNQANQALIPECIIRYPRLFEPRVIQDSGEKVYSAKLYIDQNNSEDVGNLIFKLAKSSFDEDKYNHASFHWPLTRASAHPGDAKNERLKNSFVLNAKANLDFKPSVVDRNGNPIQPDEMYSGCVVAAAIRFYPWEKFGKFGMGCGLLGILKLADGPPIADGSYDPAVLFKGLDISKYEAEVPAIEKPTWFSNADDNTN
ncbi:MAG: DUF2815 family protein [Shewanella sp.]|nr:DUF2815 family protein [Shewanella sp.]